jgi:hypothetical protein
VGLCLAVSGLAQKKETKRQKPPPPVIKLTAKEAKANVKNGKEGNQLPVPGKATGQRAKKRGVPNQNRPPRTTRSSFTANTASVTANDGTTRSSLAVSVGDPALTKQKPRAKSANQKGSPLSPENRRELRDPARKGFVDRGRPQGETWETDFGTAAAAVKPDKRVRNARQQTRNTTPKRNATKRRNNITLPQTGAVNRRKSQPSTGLDDESDMTWEALDTIDTKLDELTTKIADTILRSADDPVLKRQSQIRQRRILEIKELLKVLKENFQTSTV